ncbi:MAG: type VI secretion system contractile sheath large subunit [Bacteroidetes bacterium]|jgi:type VI secretion system protein ImpC|nr:type VI secretion system contractile sheath large subunit [Bacteroidota bacterium]
MAEVKQEAGAQATEVTEESKESVLDGIFKQVELTAPEGSVSVDEFDDAQANADKSRSSMMAAALSVFVDAVSQMDQPVEKVDKVLLDSLVGQIDEKISRQLDQIMHHEDFQNLESSWRGLKFVVDRTNFRKNVKIELMHATKKEMLESFEDAPELIQSALYKHVYTNAYDQPGADPYSAIVSNYEFDNSPQDVALMQQLSKVSASALCPFIGGVSPQFFGKDTFAEWKKIPDLSAYMETADYIKWNSFRESEDSRYIGLTMPRFMLRLPYGEDTVPVDAFNYDEDVKGTADHEDYLWGNASYSFAANMVQAYMKDGWCVQIRGPQSGGKVEDLPVHLYDVGKGKEMKIPTEVPISETLEFEAANLGFIPLSIYEGRDFACFFSANSAQKPKIYDDPDATANSRINARLPYVFLASRISHYLKVLQRENIGAAKDAETIESELNRWLNGLVTKMANPSQDVIAKYPLREGQVKVFDYPDNPGFYGVQMMIMPHFQIEGMDISLSMVSKMPKEQS